MKVIKQIYIAFIILCLCSCENEDNKRFGSEDAAFVRFFLLADNNNNVLEFPEKNGGLIAKSIYDKDNLKTLKIPVILTTTTLQNTVNVSFETSVNGLDNYTISPANSLSFNNDKRIDTIFIKLNERWDLSKNPQIKLTLTEVSEPNISLGFPNEQISNKELIIGFKEIEFSYLFNTSRKEINGNINESFDFSVLFPNGFIASEINNIPLFSQPSTFNYTIVKKPIAKETEVAFTLTVNENINDDVDLNAFLNLLDVDNYKKGANQSLQINKPIKVDREGNPAANFYDLQTPNYRLRGERWRPDADNPGSCEWFPTNVFSVPVIVDKNDLNGIFISDNGTPNDDSDDIYHHRYKIGMVGPIAGRTTNPFGLKNLLEGESSDNSPGFNIIEAIEFFPANGNSTTEGKISIVAQNLIIVRSSDDRAFSVPISGVGTYKVIDAIANVWQMSFEITFDFSQINGTIITLPMVYNNLPGQPEPPLLNNTCFEVIQL